MLFPQLPIQQLMAGPAASTHELPSVTRTAALFSPYRALCDRTDH